MFKAYKGAVSHSGAIKRIIHNKNVYFKYRGPNSRGNMWSEYRRRREGGDERNILYNLQHPSVEVCALFLPLYSVNTLDATTL
jgi:hypothetical protein